MSHIYEALEKAEQERNKQTVKRKREAETLQGGNQPAFHAV